MANRNKSTNFKLTAIIHSKNNDQEEEAEIHELEALAKTRLRRTTLYSGGARTKIPRIKKPAPLSSSPFQVYLKFIHNFYYFLKSSEYS